jgi:hypothetical protein
MKSAAFALLVLVLPGCSSDPKIAVACFPCRDYWICSGDVTRIDLTPAADGCYLSGLPGRNLLSPDGRITADGIVVGMATGTGARVSVVRPDGTPWLFCAAGGGCRD